ncbi:MAG: MinD/ParA family protein [Selenomonadaceae bacterium]|nr:MinD/ParA family protein [Selenomonadaceae bacterium]
MTDQATKLRQLVTDKEPDVSEALKEAASPIAPPTLSGAREDTRVIAITSGKGGVGKTNLTVNLAIALGQKGHRVLVIDADLGMANVDVVLGSMSRHHLLNLLEDDVELDDVLIQGPYGIHYISGGSGIEKAQDFSYEDRQKLMHKLSGCGKLADIILVDTGAGLGKNVMDFILAADEVYLVTTPEPTALTDAYAVMKAYSMYATNKNIKLVVNRVYDEQESNDVVTKLQQTSEKFLKMPIGCLGYIYEDRSVASAVRNQKPFLVSQPKSVAAKCVIAMADTVLYGGRMTVKKGWRGFLQQIFNFSRV